MSIPDYASPDVNSGCSVYNLSLKVRCHTSHFFRCTVFFKVERIFDLDMSSYFSESRGGFDGYGGKSIPLASIRKCLNVLLVSLILNN